MSVERKGYEKGKGLNLGAEPPRIKLSKSLIPPGTHRRPYMVSYYITRTQQNKALRILLEGGETNINRN